MSIKMKRFLGILLSLALVLGLVPGMSLTAYAGNATQVIFGSVELETGVKYTVVGTGSNQRIEKSNSNPETGFIQWNSDTSTLELNNVSYSGTDTSGKAIQSNGDLTIHLSGVNSVTENGFVNPWGFPYSYGIYNKDSLTTIEAEIDGSLTVTGGSSSQGRDRRYSYGICSGGIRVKSGNIVAKGGDLPQDYSCSYGISDLNSYTELSIDGGGVLTCIGGETTGNPGHSYGIVGFEIDLKDGTLISTGGENVFEYTSYTVQSGCKAYVSSSKDGTETSECGAGQSINSGSKYKYIKIKSLHKSTITAVPTASDITYGQKLENSVLTGGTANVDGTFTWKDKTTAPVVADSQSAEYDVVFTPTDNDNYKTAECKVKLTISKKAVTANVSAEDKPYDGKTDVTVTASVPTEALVSGDSIEIAGIKGSFDDANVGAGKKVTVDSSAKSISGRGSDNYEVTIPAETTASIIKAQDAYTVTVTNDGHGTGTATPSSGTTGTEVKLTSAPETGYSFKEWQVVSGGVTITNNSFKIGNADVEIKAIFTKDPVNYNTVSVTGSEHIISGGKNAVITVKGIPDDSRTYSSFTGAAMDGQPIPTGNYTAEEGSLILTLKASYLDTLSVGKHKLTINFTDGSADTTITVLAKPVPKTGDNSNPALWLAMMILGLAVLAGTAVKVYRKRQ